MSMETQHGVPRSRIWVVSGTKVSQSLSPGLPRVQGLLTHCWWDTMGVHDSHLLLLIMNRLSRSLRAARPGCTRLFL